jgi:hypothetical protein
VTLDVSSKAYAESFADLKHGITIAADDSTVYDGRGGWQGRERVAEILEV